MTSNQKVLVLILSWIPSSRIQLLEGQALFVRSIICDEEYNQPSLIWNRIFCSVYLLHRVKVLVIEVPQEPEDSRSQYLSDQHHKGGQVEDEDHPCQPVEEGYCALKCISDEGGVERERGRVSVFVQCVCEVHVYIFCGSSTINVGYYGERTWSKFLHKHIVWRTYNTFIYRALMWWREREREGESVFFRNVARGTKSTNQASELLSEFNVDYQWGGRGATGNCPPLPPLFILKV